MRRLLVLFLVNLFEKEIVLIGLPTRTFRLMFKLAIITDIARLFPFTQNIERFIRCSRLLKIMCNLLRPVRNGSSRVAYKGLLIRQM